MAEERKFEVIDHHAMSISLYHEATKKNGSERIELLKASASFAIAAEIGIVFNLLCERMPQSHAEKESVN